MYIHNSAIKLRIINTKLTFSFFQSVLEICALWANVAGCIVTFYKVNRTASYIMTPYLGWLTLATALTYNIYKNNSEISDKPVKDK